MGNIAARLTDQHVCPAVSGVVPHVGGPILGPCAPTVITGGQPQAKMGDLAFCAGGPATILMGSTTVMVMGSNAARLNDPTAHGGMIMSGFPTVVIGG